VSPDLTYFNNLIKNCQINEIQIELEQKIVHQLNMAGTLEVRLSGVLSVKK